MFKTIMVAVDLHHLEALERSLAVAGDLASHFGASVTYVSIGATFKSEDYDPKTFEENLTSFAQEQSKLHGINTSIHAITSVDPTIELDWLLLDAVEKTGADLVIMGSHRPGLAEYFFASNAGYVAGHAPVSVMVIR